MIAKNKVKGAAPTVKDAECPRCERLLSAPNIVPRPDRYNRELRECIGWCEDCDAGYRVVQFKYGNKWITHEYRFYGYENDKPKHYEGWHRVVDLPDAPLVLTGPGGDFDKAIEEYDLDDIGRKQLQQVKQILQDAIGAAIEILKNRKLKRKTDD